MRSLMHLKARTMTATKQLIRVGHSPDPDDAFMFYALAKDQIDAADYEFHARAGGHRNAQPPGI